MGGVPIFSTLQCGQWPFAKDRFNKASAGLAANCHLLKIHTSM